MEYIDFYGYCGEKYENLTKDFVECLEGHNPVVSDEQIVITNFGRYQRKILVSGVHRKENILKSIEEKMTQKGYKRYIDYNFYDNLFLI